MATWTVASARVGYVMTNYFKDKRVLITGGAGFLASHLAPKLEAAGATVIRMDDFSRGQNDKRKCVKVDLSRGRVATTVFSNYKPEIVFNLAAWVAGVIYNQKNHSEMFTKNLALQTAPLQAAIDCGTVKRFVQVSSACVYAPEYNHPAVEENGHKGEPVQANVGYSLAKRMGERLAVWAYQEFDLETVIVRPSNLYGERDYFDNRAHVIPALIRKCYEQDPIKFYGAGEEVREFLYAGDCADGLMAAAERGRPGEAYNLGTNGGTSVTIRQLFDLVRKFTDTEHKRVKVVESHDPGDPARWSNGAKATSELGWSAQTMMGEGLTRTVEWYNEHR